MSKILYIEMHTQFQPATRVIDQIEILMQLGSRKGFSGGSQKIIGVYINWRLERCIATRRELVWGRQLPIVEHGLQFRFNEITYFREH